MALLKLPRLYLLALPVGTELDLDAAGAQEGCWAARRGLLGANLVSLNSPRLGKLVHIELELAVTSHGVVTLVAIVVPAEAAEASSQVGSSHDLHKTVAVPRDLQTCRGRETNLNVYHTNQTEVSAFCVF